MPHPWPMRHRARGLRYQRPIEARAANPRAAACIGASRTRGDTRKANAARCESRAVRQAVTAFARVDGELRVEGIPLADIAEQFGTPCYVYSRAALESAWREYD